MLYKWWSALPLGKMRKYDMFKVWEENDPDSSPQLPQLQIFCPLVWTRYQICILTIGSEIRILSVWRCSRGTGILGQESENGSDDKHLHPESALHPNHYLIALCSKSDPLMHRTYQSQRHHVKHLLLTSELWDSGKLTKNMQSEIRESLIVQNYAGLPFSRLYQL